MHRLRYMLGKEATISTRPQKAPRHAIHLLQRCVNPGRMYQQNNDCISYEELLALDQNINRLRAFTERDVKWKERGFYWQGNRPRKDGERWYYIVRREVWKRWKKKSSVDHDKRQSLKKETKVRVQGRFYEAFKILSLLSLLQEHSSWKKNDSLWRNGTKDRIIDDVTLTRFREHLSLEEILNTWVV